MAFGSWFKNLVQGASKILRKVAPVTRKIIGGIQKLAPIVGPVIGGSAGKLISDVGKFAGKVEKVQSAADKVLGWNAVSKLNADPRYLVSASDRFAQPMLKNS